MRWINNVYLGIVVILLLVVAVTCSRSPVSENNDSTSAVEADSIAFVEERLALGDELSELRDSITNTISIMEEKRSKSKEGEADKFGEAIGTLSLNKDKVERDLEEVNSTALKGWDNDDVERIRTTMEQVKTELERINTE